jgi:hypothetical protein
MSQPPDYYSYLKKYNPHFINRYENWAHGSFARGSGFKNLQFFRAYIMLTNHMTILPGYRFKSFFFYAGALMCVFDLWGIWISQEMYNKYTAHKWNHYQTWFHKDCYEDQEDYPYPSLDPTEEKKPFTRDNYSDRVKIVYDGVEEKDIFSNRRYRYR